MVSTDANSDASAASPLHELQSTGKCEIMDLVVNLRRLGLTNVLQVPQIVVCGNQSSGKSSVLEAISEIPFPRKETLCTRFATEIIMRNQSEESILAKIVPDRAKPLNEQAELKEFSESFAGLTQLSELFQRAMAAMGLDNQSSDAARAFTADVLSVEISGPGLPYLILVDLPGLIQSESNSSSEKDIDFVHQLVESYISRERTIILAVVGAKDDYSNQVVLKRCRKVDPEGKRTLGIITKPDDLRKDSERERAWIDLALNRDIKFERGWHVLKNRTEDEEHFSSRERNDSEQTFLRKGNYCDLPEASKGISSLRLRLSELLECHLKEELPGLLEDLEGLLVTTNKDLHRLGVARSTVREQREYLIDTAMAAQDILKSAVNGSYESAFFGQIDLDQPVSSSMNVRRLRAVLQQLNLQFAASMRSCGHKYNIGLRSSPSATESNSDEAEISQDAPGASESVSRPKKLSRKKAIKWVLDVLQRSRGQELPGTFNPLLISQLFWQQSEPWQALAQTHIDNVAAACQKFVQVLMEAVAPPELSARLFRLNVENGLKTAINKSRFELDLIIADAKRHPMTYNHYFTTTLQRLRQERRDLDITRLVDSATVRVEGTDLWHPHKEFIHPSRLKANLASSIEQDMDKVSAEEILDNLAAYYKDEMKYFIGAVTKQVIERHVASSLPSLISPMVVAALSDNEIKHISAEPLIVTRQREDLKEQKAMLEAGQEAFRLALVNLR